MLVFLVSKKSMKKGRKFLQTRGHSKRFSNGQLINETNSTLCSQCLWFILAKAWGQQLSLILCKVHSDRFSTLSMRVSKLGSIDKLIGGRLSGLEANRHTENTMQIWKRRRFSAKFPWDYCGFGTKIRHLWIPLQGCENTVQCCPVFSPHPVCSTWDECDDIWHISCFVRN